MGMYNTSSAHNLSEFEDALKKELESPNLKVVKNRKKAPASILGPGVVCAFLVIVALITLIVYNNVQLNELTNEINQLAHELEVLQSEDVRMTSALESTISNIEVGRLAREMGMQPRTEFQTERIYLYQQDKIERAAAVEQTSVAEDAKLAVTSLFGRFQEYIGKR